MIGRAANGKNMFKDAKYNTLRNVVIAAMLLGLASLSLLLAQFLRTNTAIFLGQVMFVLFVFSAFSLLVVTGISQDIRRKRRVQRREPNELRDAF